MIIAQPKELIAQFVALRQGKPAHEQWGPFSALGLTRGDMLIAGVVYNNFEAANVCAHIGAVDGRHWMTRAFLHAMFAYPFEQMGKRRITALVARKNKHARKFVDNLGFTYEGCLKNYYENDSLIVYGLLRENCRFLHGRHLPLELKEAA